MRKTARWPRIAVSLTLVAAILGSNALWLEQVSAAQGDGVLLYAASLNTTPQVKDYSEQSNSFGSANGTVAGLQPTIVQLKSSPFKNEMIAGYEDTLGNLQIMCYDGTSWSNEWSVSVGGLGTTRRFDIALETSTGDVTVAYSRNTAAVNALAYRTKSGSSGCGSANWSSATNFPTTTSTTTGTVQWVKAARDGRGSSTLDAFIWADSNADLGAAIWSGSAMTNFRLLETSLEVVTTTQDVDDFELQYESVSGDLMVVWANSAGTNGTQGAYYSTCTGGTSSCTWLTSTKISTATGDDATTLDLSADPNSDKMAFASIGNAGSDLQAAYWSGSAWTFYANRDTACETPQAGRRLVQTGWVSNGGNTRWVLTYDDATGSGLSWYAAMPGTAPVKQTDFATTPSINDIRHRYQLDHNPFESSQLMLLVSDSTQAVMAERLTMDGSGNLTWTDANGGSAAATTASGPAEGFSFQYKRYVPPGSLSVDIVDSGGSSVASPSVVLSSLAANDQCQTSTGILGAANQKIRVSNSTVNPAWSVGIAASSGNTSNWSSGTDTYDFNDSGGSPAGCGDGADADSLAGQLAVDPSAATSTPAAGCTNTGVTLGSSSAFSQGVTDSITIASASASADTDCYWDVTGASLSQKIPSLQSPGTYSLQFTITVVAN